MHLPPLSRQRNDPADAETWLVIDTITDPEFQGLQPQGRHIPKRATTPTLFYPHAGPHGRPHVPGTPATEQGTAVYLPLGAVVATCELVDVVPTGGLIHWHDSPRDYDRRWLTVVQSADGPIHHVEVIPDEFAYGDFTAGRFAWLLDDIKPLAEPVPAKGRQGLWEWTP
jgi:hypothetical protein